MVSKPSLTGIIEELLVNGEQPRSLAKSQLIAVKHFRLHKNEPMQKDEFSKRHIRCRDLHRMFREERINKKTENPCRQLQVCSERASAPPSALINFVAYIQLGHGFGCPGGRCIFPLVICQRPLTGAIRVHHKELAIRLRNVVV